MVEDPDVGCMASVFDWAVVVDHTHVGLFEYRPTGEARAFRGGRDFVGRWSKTPTWVAMAAMPAIAAMAYGVCVGFG